MSAGAEGMAPGEAFEREPATLGHAVKSDGLGRVVRARGHEAARARKERRNNEFVAAEHKQRDGNRARPPSSEAKGAVVASAGGEDCVRERS